MRELICEVKKCDRMCCRYDDYCCKGCYTFDKRSNTLTNYRRRPWKKSLGKFELKDIRKQCGAGVANYFIEKQYIRERVDGATFYY